jgi:ribonuclease D
LEADTLLAARALAQWRDSLALRRDLPPDLERAARVLADSLSAFLANRP